MSISEYPSELESRYRDIDVSSHACDMHVTCWIHVHYVLQTKSTYTMDARSEYGGGIGGLLPLWEEDPVIGQLSS